MVKSVFALDSTVLRPFFFSFVPFYFLLFFFKTNQYTIDQSRPQSQSPISHEDDSRVLFNFLLFFFFKNYHSTLSIDIAYTPNVLPPLSSRYRPYIYIYIYMCIYIYGARIRGINERARVRVCVSYQDFTLDFYFRQFWTDPRLAFKKRTGVETLSVGSEFIKNIWVPDTFFVNEKQSYFHIATTSNEFIRIHHSGSITRSIRWVVCTVVNLFHNTLCFPTRKFKWVFFLSLSFNRSWY